MKNWAYENLVFVPADSANVGPFNISHIDIVATTATSNGGTAGVFCVDNVSGKVSMILKKDFGRERCHSLKKCIKKVFWKFRLDGFLLNRRCIHFISCNFSFY